MGSASRLRQVLSPFDLSIYQIGGKYAWDPAEIYDELALRKVRCSTLPRDRDAGIEHVAASIRNIRKVVAAVLRAEESPAPRPSRGILQGVPEPSVPQRGKESIMMEEKETPIGFADRVKEDAIREAARVLADLERLRFDAEQVTRVMRALGIPVPALLAAITDVEAEKTAEFNRAVIPAEDWEGTEGPKTTTEIPAPDLAQRKPEPVAEKASPKRKAPAQSDRSAAATAFANEVLAVIAEGPSIKGEIAKKLRHLNESPTQDAFNQRVYQAIVTLKGQGRIRETGVSRYPKGHTSGGRTSPEYAIVGDASPNAGAPAPVAEPEQLVVDPEALAKVRDFVTGQKHPFDTSKVCKATSLARAQVVLALRALEGRHVLENVGMDGFDLWEYRKPTEPGRAAVIDRQRVRAEDLREGSAPVAGTGKPERAANSEMGKLLLKARRAGATVSHENSGHFRVEYDGRSCQVPSTPRSAAGIRNAAARIRQLGVGV